MDSRQLVKIAKALADPTRHRMLEQIRSGGELNCSQICSAFPLSQPTISHHIKLLVASGLVKARKEGSFHVLKADEALLRRFASAVAAAPAGSARRAPRPRRRAGAAAPRSGGRPRS